MKNFMEVGEEFDARMVQLGEVQPVAMNAFGTMAAEAGRGDSLPAKVREIVSLAVTTCLRGVGRSSGI